MWEFIQDQILGMKWLSSLIGRLLTAVGLDVNTRIGGSVQFFLYDVIKITVLLCVLIFLISYIQSFFPPERSRKIMGRFHGVGANIVGALLGTVTPFCSCSSIPIFMGFTSAGLPLGVTFSFLISSVPDFVSDGGSGKPCSADEHFRPEDSYRLCDFGIGNRSDRRDADREAPYGGSDCGFHSKQQ